MPRSAAAGAQSLHAPPSRPPLRALQNLANNSGTTDRPFRVHLREPTVPEHGRGWGARAVTPGTGRQRPFLGGHCQAGNGSKSRGCALYSPWGVSHRAPERTKAAHYRDRQFGEGVQPRPPAPGDRKQALWGGREVPRADCT